MHLSRRQFLRDGASSLGALACVGSRPPALCARAPEPVQAPVRPLTKGPKFHWFGYYDKHQFDPTDRYVLGMQVDFQHRSPGPDDTIRIGMVDHKRDDAWIELGTSRAWCWQQGCMLQWRPGSKNEVVWNDRDASGFVSRILNVETRELRTLPRPIYTLSPDGKWRTISARKRPRCSQHFVRAAA